MPLSEDSLQELHQANMVPPTGYQLSFQSNTEKIHQYRRHGSSGGNRDRLTRESPPVQNISIQNMTNVGLDDGEDYDYDYDYRRGDGIDDESAM